MRGLIAWTVVAITVLSLWWTTRKARALLRQALGRELRDGEEMSLTSWMQASDASLETASKQLDRDPFERCLRFITSLGFKWHLRAQTGQHLSLQSPPAPQSKTSGPVI